MKNELNHIKIKEINVTFKELIKKKLKEKKDQVDDSQVVLWKIAKSEVFEISVLAHETTYDYPENQMQVLWKNTPM